MVGTAGRLAGRPAGRPAGQPECSRKGSSKSIIFDRFYKGFGNLAHAMKKVAFRQGFIRVPGCLFAPFAPLRATHFPFRLCFIRVSARWKGCGNVIIMIRKYSFYLCFSGFFPILVEGHKHGEEPL